jgi:hypothetical protein
METVKPGVEVRSKPEIQAQITLLENQMKRMELDLPRVIEAQINDFRNKHEKHMAALAKRINELKIYIN